jgi:hypothetical protein
MTLLLAWWLMGISFGLGVLTGFYLYWLTEHTLVVETPRARRLRVIK